LFRYFALIDNVLLYEVSTRYPISYNPTSISDNMDLFSKHSEVGAPLYKIDTEATEAPGGFFEVAAAGDDGEVEEGAESAGGDGVAAAKDGSSSSSRSGGHVRVPSIHFLGKVGWSKKLSAPVRDAAADIAAGVPPAVGGPAPTSVSADLGPMYGRPAISDKEMEALILGGAEEAPKMKTPSGPALFGF